MAGMGLKVLRRAAIECLVSLNGRPSSYDQGNANDNCLSRHVSSMDSKLSLSHSSNEAMLLPVGMK